MYYKTTNYFVFRKGEFDYCINLDDGELFFNEFYHDGEPLEGNLEPSNRYEFEQAFNLYFKRISEAALIELPKSNLEIFIKSNERKMSIRLYNTLNYAVRNGFKEVYELTRETLYKLPNCGKVTANEFITLTKVNSKYENNKM